MWSVLYSGMCISFFKNCVHCLAQNFNGIHSSLQCTKHYHSISDLCSCASLLFRSFCFHVSIRLTNFMEHSYCWDPDSHQLVKKFPLLFASQMFICHIHKIPAMDPVFNQLNLIHTHHLSIRSILTMSPTLCLDLQDFWLKFWFHFSSCPCMLHTNSNVLVYGPPPVLM